MLVEESYCTVLPKTWNFGVMFLFSGCLNASKLLSEGQIYLQPVSVIIQSCKEYLRESSSYRVAQSLFELFHIAATPQRIGPSVQYLGL
jgi:hypothetical protein